jgi:Tol biopolymer transport system component
MVGWGVAAVVTLALAALAFVHFREASARPAAVRFQVPFPGTGTNRGFRIAPNGRLIAYTSDADGTLRIYVHPFDSLAARALPGTDNPRDLFWSPDSESIGFFADGKLKRVGLNGQPSQTLAPSADSRGGAWSPAGVIVFASGPNRPLYRIPDTGGTPADATKAPPAGEGFRFPEFLPDGQHFLFYHASDAPDVAGIYAGSLDGMQPVRILPDLGNAAFVPAETGKSGYIFFKREGALMAQAFDPINLRTSGGVLSIADQIPYGFGNIAWADLAAVPGVLAYVSDTTDQNSADLAWVDRAGKKADVLQGVVRLLDLSPDGAKVTFLRRDPRSTSQDPDLWVQDLTRGGTVRLTLTGAFNSIWSPDSKRVVYGYRPLTGRTNFYLIPATGAAKPELLLEAAGQNAILYDWSLDGKWILYSDTNTGFGDLVLLPAEGDHKPVTYLPKTSFRRGNARFSPDGLWMAYQSDESGRNEVYVQAVPVSSEKVTISSGGGAIPRWRRDGKELYFLTPDQKLMAVTVKTGTKFEAGVPHQILEKLGSTNYAPTADGQKFIAPQPRAGGAAPPITVVLNWQAGLKK